MLVVVDKASKFLFAHSLPTKEAIGVARKLLNQKLFLTFGVALFISQRPRNGVYG